MIPLRLDELPPLGELDANAETITGVQVDSRRIGPGDLFVAVGRGIDFLDDIHASADYRRTVTIGLTRRAILAAAERAG